MTAVPTTPVALDIRPIFGIGDVTPGMDLAEVIATAAPWLLDGDILVVTSKIISKAEGRLLTLPPDGPQREAAREAALHAETARMVARRGHTRIVQTHHGFVLASAGIDASNVDRSQLVLLPADPDASARALRAALRRRTGRDVAIIVSDTMGRPWRNGLTDVALGAAGIDALRDHRGEVDAYGNELHLTQMAIVDELAGAAELVKGKCDQVPVAVVRGYFDRPRDGESGTAALIRSADQDLFSLGTAEARATGLTEAATLTDAHAFGDVPMDSATLGRVIAVAIAVAIRAAAPGTLVTPLDRVLDDPAAPARTAALISLTVAQPAGPAQYLDLGATVQRLRSALAAERLATILVRPDLLAVGGRLSPAIPEQAASARLAREP